MPIRKQLPGFWWFREGRVGGMGRPGFNRLDWDALPLADAVLLAWVGKLQDGRGTRAQLREHLAWYRREVAQVSRWSLDEFDEAVAPLVRPDGLLERLGQLNRASGLLREFTWNDNEDGLQVAFDDERIAAEGTALREQGIEVLVCLVEQTPDPAVAAAGLEVHHLPVDDMTPPAPAQVEAFGEILTAAERDGLGVVVHCLAGIGRTTTMIAAGHLHRGHSLDGLRAEIAERNPRFGFRGPQWAYLERLAAELGG